MKKTAMILLVILSILLLLPITASAEGISHVIDGASILSEAQRLRLDRQANELSSKYHCEIIVITVENMRDYGFTDIEEFSYSLYVEFDLGYGVDRDCVLLVLSLSDREYDFRIWGDWTHTAFTLYGIDKLIDDHLLAELENNNYYQAFLALYDRAELYFQMAENGRPFSAKNDPDRVPGKILIIILASFVPAFLVCSGWKGKMKTAKIATTANNYIPDGGFRLIEQGDIYLYRTVSRTRIERTSSSSSSSSRASSGGRGGSSGRSGRF